MTQLTYQIRTHVLEGTNGTGDDVTIVELVLQGFIDAANFRTFEKALDEAAAEDKKSLVVDFARVSYINSTGISALIRHFERYRERGGVLCLVSVSKPVGLSMHLLGVTSLISFAKDVAAGRAYVTDFLRNPRRVSAAPPVVPEVAPSSSHTAVGEHDKPAAAAAETRVAQGRVLVISPVKSRFTSVLGRRYKRRAAVYHLVHDVHEAFRQFDSINPDLVVVDDRCDPDGEFVSRTKVQKERSLTSVIKIYGRETDVQGSVAFKIWENDYLIDPFPMLEFFSLVEGELRRVPRDRSVFNQQVHFEFRTTDENVQKAYKLADLVIRSGVNDEEEITALYAAVKEGIDNAVVHGNGRDEKKTVDINFLVDHSKVTVIVEDQGAGFDYEYYLSRLHRDDAFEEAKRRIVQENMRGGLGILLMSRCTDRLQYSGPGNTLRLEKNLHS